MDTEDIEIALLIEAIRLKYGYDFRQYANASLYRRIQKCLEDSGLRNISDMVPRIVHDREFFKTFLNSLSVNVTEMFRDPTSFQVMREQLVPYLETFPFLKIWSVGVSTGEEVYSLAILLKEEGLYDKSLIYATDFNDTVLETARKGIYSAEDIKKSTRNYQESGGKTSFSKYYHADYNSVILKGSLKENIVFANHNIVTDSVFGEMNLILCRNVLIYFNKELQERAFSLFDASLGNRGFLCLGSKESLQFSSLAGSYDIIDGKQKIYQKTS